jgi:hypothetical protein
MKYCYIKGLKFLLFAAYLFFTGCQHQKEKVAMYDENVIEYKQGTFGYDRDFISSHTDIVLLKDKTSQSCLISSPAYQGRVLTSSFDGMEGKSLGYINHERIASDEMTPHIQGYGGEDRFWIGPQGGQYTIYFNPGDPFDFDHWFTPSPIDKEPFELIAANDSSVHYRKGMKLVNYINTEFAIEVNRKINIVEMDKARELLKLPELKDLKYVGFESINELTNTGEEEWKKESGLLSIWILGMFPGGSTVIIPYKESPEAAYGYSEYFVEILGDLDEDHLKTGKDAIYYNGSGDYIGKIGIRPEYTKPYLGSYDENNNILTIVQYSLQEGVTDYVNSQWEIQERPYEGDVVNAYNDGPLSREPGAEPTFYELESSSPARELSPGETLVHYHRTFHFQGEKGQLNRICKALFNTSIEDIVDQF